EQSGRTVPVGTLWLAPTRLENLRPCRRGEPATGCVGADRPRSVVSEPDARDERRRETDEPDVGAAVRRSCLAGNGSGDAVIPNCPARAEIDDAAQHRSDLI